MQNKEDSKSHYHFSAINFGEVAACKNCKQMQIREFLYSRRCVVFKSAKYLEFPIQEAGLLS